MKRTLLLIAGCFLMTIGVADARDVTIGVVRDGPQPRDFVPLDLMHKEVEDLLGTEFRATFPPDKQLDGGWSLQGIRNALSQLLTDSSVDIVIATGLIASNEAARYPNLTKPMIAVVVVDPGLQQFPLRDGKSGRNNFTYLANFASVAEELRAFHEITDFKKLGVFVDQLSLEAIPSLRELADRIAREMGTEFVFVPVTDSVDAPLQKLPADVDAVYIAPLLRLNVEQMEQLANELIKRRLPSLSLLGGAEVEQGLLMSLAIPADNIRLARRLALILQRILLGENPRDLAVTFSQGQRITINMRTARAIGFSPRWSVLIDAERLYVEEDQGPRLTLTDAMLEAVASNPALDAAREVVLAAGDDVDVATSALRPQFDLGAGATRIDEDRANPLLQSEQQSDVEIVASQLIYSERAYAGRRIAQYLYEAAEHDLQVVVLDTLRAAAIAYLNVLRAQALEAVQQSNLEVTRTNLDLAKARERIGFSGRADVLRWESQIALDRQNLLAAQADRRAAIIEVNRILHRPIGEPFSTADSGLDKPMTVIEDPRFKTFVDNPIVWEVFQDFSTEQALGNAPELKAFDETIAAQERQVTAARRAYYVPDVALRGSAGTVINRSGAGSNPSLLGLDDDQWSVGLQATLPLYRGGERRAELSLAQHNLSQLEFGRLSVTDVVAARIRAALEQVGASYPAIELSRKAADAATENLALVMDSYSKGAVSVTDLIDAQDNALAADLDAAEAEYTFLIDYARVSRASGSFQLWLDPASAQAWFELAEQFFESRGVQPLTE